MLLYFLRGSLPWQGLRAETKKEKYQRILDTKLSVDLKDLCEGFPPAFYVYLNYCRELRFDETPNYEYLRNLFRTAMIERNERDDGVFDWIDNSRTHIPAALPRYFVDEGGSLREDLRIPAPRAYSRCVLREGRSARLCSPIDVERELRDSGTSWNELRKPETRNSEAERNQIGLSSDTSLVTPNGHTSMENHSGEEAEEGRTAAKAEQKVLLKVDQNMFIVCLNGSFDRSY